MIMNPVVFKLIADTRQTEFEDGGGEVPFIKYIDL